MARNVSEDVRVSEDVIFAALPPLARIAFLAKNDKKGLAFWAITLAASLYMIFRSVVSLLPAIWR